MDKKTIQSDFKLLVDSTVELLEKFNKSDRCDAINYMLNVVQRKFPESCEPIRSFCGNLQLTGRELQRRQHSLNISQQGQSQQQQQQHPQSGTDLNQNFEKILCKEEFQYIEDDYLDSKSIKHEDDKTLVVKYDDDWVTSAVSRNNLKRSYSNCLGRHFGGRVILSERTIGNSSRFSILNSNSTSSDCIKLLRSKRECGQFTFYPDSEIKLVYNHWYGMFCSRSYRQQFRYLLQFALDYHHKPFLRKFYKNILICGGIDGIKPLQSIIDLNNRKKLLQQSKSNDNFNVDDDRQLVPALNYFQTIKTENKNGLQYIQERVDEYSDAHHHEIEELPNDDEYPMVTYPMEDTSQTTDSSEDATNLMNAETENNSTGSILNSIVGEQQPKVMMSLSNTQNMMLDDVDIDDGDGDGVELNASGGQAPPAKKPKPSYCCLLCPKSYRKRKSLIDHYKLHPGYCHDCGNPNGHTLEEIIEHNRTVHAKDFPFVCETCGESYSRRQQFHAHVEAHNKNQSKTYSCQECGMKFSDKKLQQQHLDDTGHRADGAICEVCGATVASKNALAQHIAKIHKKDNYFECHICQNRFTLKANLERHVQLHTEVKRTYVCDKCGSSYFTYAALKDHYSNAHTDASECKCTLCGKTFGSVKSLQRHLPSHSEERPHSCTYCTMTFKWKTHLVRHKQSEHGNQSNSKKVKKSTKIEEGLNTNDAPPLPQSPAKPPKKSSSSKPKQHQQQQQQQQLQHQHQQQQMMQQQNMLVVNTPAPMPTSTIQQPSQLQQQMGSLITNSNNHASTSHLAESQTTMYSQSFNAENLLGQQCNPPQQSPQNNHQQQQQQQPPQTPQTPQQRRTPNVENNLIIRMPSFNPGAEQQYHFDPNASNYNHIHQQQQQRHPQDQLLTQYQQQHMRSQTQSPMQQNQHFQSPHHIPHHQQQQHIQHPHPTTPTPPQLHHQQILHQQNHQQSPHHTHGRHQQSPQPQQQPPPQQYPCASIQQSSADWNNLNFSSPTPTNANPSGGNLDVKDNKFYSVIHVNSTDFLGLPMDVSSTPPAGSSKQDTTAALSADIINFQNMWPHPPQQSQLNFTNQSQSAPAGSNDPHSYNNNIGSILTNLELIGNNNPMDYNFELLPQPPTNSHHPQHAQQTPHHPYVLPSPGASLLNYDYTTPNHTLTDISDQKNAFQPYHHHHSPAAATPPPPVPSYDPHAGTSSRAYATDESKTILPPISDYMQHHPNLQQNPDVNLVYYPSEK